MLLCRRLQDSDNRSDGAGETRQRACLRRRDGAGRGLGAVRPGRERGVSAGSRVLPTGKDGSGADPEPSGGRNILRKVHHSAQFSDCTRISLLPC